MVIKNTNGNDRNFEQIFLGRIKSSWMLRVGICRLNRGEKTDFGVCNFLPQALSSHKTFSLHPDPKH